MNYLEKYFNPDFAKEIYTSLYTYKLIERLIKCSTNEGMNVLDIFMGSCMTALVCKETNRNYFGCELNDAYFKENLISE